ncbi:hypothetical protein [Armatimonas sp.]|uniref:hypothetical protein n=1 Tax=Armatimonas sp. TaxID=1872638 RepID=UPI00286AE876|nr:hypothetical protein [Armatimonas sp.]
MQRKRTRDSDREWLRKRLVAQLKLDEKPTLLEDVDTDIALSLLAEQFLEQTRKDRRTQKRRWLMHPFRNASWGTVLLLILCGLPLAFLAPEGIAGALAVGWADRKKGPSRDALFMVYSLRWYKLAELLRETGLQTRSGESVAMLIQVLSQLNSDQTREETELEATLTRRIADVLPFLSTTELERLPEPCWAFLEKAIEQRVTVDKLERLPWMKAGFTVAAILALGSVKRRKVEKMEPLMRHLAEHDTEGRVREVARDYLATP